MKSYVVARGFLKITRIYDFRCPHTFGWSLDAICVKTGFVNMFNKPD